MTRKARKLRKDTGNEKYRARVESERESMKTLIWISCTRPICKYSNLYLNGGFLTRFTVLLTTEPIVASFSVRNETVFFMIMR